MLAGFGERQPWDLGGKRIRGLGCAMGLEYFISVGSEVAFPAPGEHGGQG